MNVIVKHAPRADESVPQATSSSVPVGFSAVLLAVMLSTVGSGAVPHVRPATDRGSTTVPDLSGVGSAAATSADAALTTMTDRSDRADAGAPVQAASDHVAGDPVASGDVGNDERAAGDVATAAPPAPALAASLPPVPAVVPAVVPAPLDAAAVTVSPSSTATSPLAPTGSTDARPASATAPTPEGLPSEPTAGGTVRSAVPSLLFSDNPATASTSAPSAVATGSNLLAVTDALIAPVLGGVAPRSANRHGVDPADADITASSAGADSRSGATVAAAPRPDGPVPAHAAALPSGSTGVYNVDRIRYVRAMAPNREVQRLALDLDGVRVSVRFEASRVTVGIVADPDDTLGSGWVRQVERTLDQAARATGSTAAGGQHMDSRSGHGPGQQGGELAGDTRQRRAHTQSVLAERSTEGRTHSRWVRAAQHLALQGANGPIGTGRTTAGGTDITNGMI